MTQEDEAWLDYRASFADIYHDSNYSSPLQSAVMSASHRNAEKKFTKDDHFSKVLEIGVGTGEHLPFLRHSFDQYILSDSDAKTLSVAKNNLAGEHSNKLSFEVQKGSELSYKDKSFDRLIATHVLEHICYPHLALKEWRRVVKDDGIISIVIPTDPGLAWRLGRHFGPRKNSIAQGIDYDYIMAREHINSCNNLIALMRHYFPERKEIWWPFPIASIDLNLFFICHLIVKKI